MKLPMPEPTFDRDGYPTDETIRIVASWTDPNEVLDFVKSAWHWPELASTVISSCESAIVHAEVGDRFLRLATGGWSGNESLVTALEDNAAIRCWCWVLSARGGLWIYKYRSIRNT